MLVLEAQKDLMKGKTYEKRGGSCSSILAVVVVGVRCLVEFQLS